MSGWVLPQVNTRFLQKKMDRELPYHREKLTHSQAGTMHAPNKSSCHKDWPFQTVCLCYFTSYCPLMTEF